MFKKLLIVVLNKTMDPHSKVFDILACPICKGKLRYDQKANELICNFDKLAYPIKASALTHEDHVRHNDVPVMIADKAKQR